MMITIEKLKKYEYYDGDIDSLAHGPKRDRRVISEEEFLLIETLSQDLKLIRSGLASSNYAEIVWGKLEDVCDSENTINYFKEMIVK